MTFCFKFGKPVNCLKVHSQTVSFFRSFQNFLRTIVFTTQFQLHDLSKEGEILFGTIDTWIIWKLSKGAPNYNSFYFSRKENFLVSDAFILICTFGKGVWPKIVDLLQKQQVFCIMVVLCFTKLTEKHLVEIFF